jgi:type IV pilus modification protein PilV
VNRRRRQRGFGLIEAMVAMVVTGIGLLGVAALQSLALADTGIARNRSLAAIEASSLAASLRANRAYWASGAVPATITVTSAGAGDASLQALTADCASVSCTPAQMAAYDLRQWGSDLAAQLPAGSGGVNCPSGVVPPACTVIVDWQERNVTGAASPVTAGSAQQSYRLLVQP